VALSKRRAPERAVEWVVVDTTLLLVVEVMIEESKWYMRK
jgi:hypothetical protein